MPSLFEDLLTPEQILFRDSVRGFAERHLAADDCVPVAHEGGVVAVKGVEWHRHAKPAAQQRRRRQHALPLAAALLPLS